MLDTLKIKGEEFKVAVSDNDASHYKGLSGLARLGKRKGMLFIFPDKNNVKMVMRDMNFPLDFIFISDSKIVQLGTLENDAKAEIISEEPIMLILEVNKGIIEELGLKIGDPIEFSKSIITHYKGVQKFKEGGSFEMVGDKVYKVKTDDVVIEDHKLQVLNTDGEVAANIESGARIFSRKHTKVIIDLVKNGDKENLGKTIVEIFDIQNKQGQEYVKR